MAKYNNSIIGRIGGGNPPLIAAELSCNHNQSLDRALALVEAVAKAGAHAVKLQTYTADTLTLNISTEDFMLRDPDSLWKDTRLYDLFEKAHTPWEWHKPIFQLAESLGLIYFSSPFDESAVEFLEQFDIAAYKIASFEITHLPLIRKAAATGKPIILSTGMASFDEIAQAVETARAAGCPNIYLLKCTSAYPARSEDANLLTIPEMKKLFGCEIGLSDHTLGLAVPVVAVAHGAVIIEKHFTLSRSDGGLDAPYSLEPHELKELVEISATAAKTLGKIQFGSVESEKASLQERRSLYITRDMKQGDVFSPDNVRCIRPSFGLEPKYYDFVMGKKVSRNVSLGTALKWKLIMDEEENED